MAICDFLERNARLYPNEISLIEINPDHQPDHAITWREYNLIESAAHTKYRREMSWREFDVKANRFANLLLTRGVGRGDKVAILLMNCIEWLPIYFGILKTGALAVPLNYRYTADEIKYCLELADVDTLVFGPEFIGRVEHTFNRLRNVKNLFYVGESVPTFADSYDLLVNYCSSIAPAVELKARDEAAIYFSSGTTGFPKAILHTHSALVSACVTEQSHHSQQHEDVFLCIPPLYHTGAKMHWFGSLMVGGRAVILRGVKPEWVLQTISEECATIVWLLVPWAQDILDAIERGELRLENYRLAQWRLMHIGAQPVPPSLIHRWQRYFPEHQYDTNYGLSESIGPGCVHLGVENIHKVGAIGKAGTNWQTAIVTETGEPVEVGAVGELIVKGPGVMKCYYKDQESTRAILKDGWLYTGDMARSDDEGFIYLVDRKKDVVISGGENIYPVQIEEFLRAHPSIKDAAVIGVPHERLGEIAAAIVELKEGAALSKAELDEFCLDLPRYKRPRKVFFAAVPRNLTGKIEKPLLRERYCGKRLVEAQTTDAGRAHING